MLGVTALLLVTGLSFQEPAPKPPGAPMPKPTHQSPPSTQQPKAEVPAATPTPTPTRIGTVQFDSSGWPIVQGDQPPTPAPVAPAKTPAPAPAGETKVISTATVSSGSAETDSKVTMGETTGESPNTLVSGTRLGSPLLEVFENTRSPGAFKALGGVVVWWRLTTYGAQGEVIGVREVTHTADCAFAERDRLEYGDGRVYGRSGASVFAERGGMPWPTANDTAQAELALFGAHLRMPWCFGDATTFVVVGRDTVTRSGDALARIQIERRPPAGTEIIGPELDPSPRDRFELLYEPSGGLLREFVHRFANSLQTRRVLLEDWHDVSGVRMPHRRVYVDESLRQTTTLEILRIEQQRTNERDFRLR